MIHVIAEISVKLGQRDEFLELFGQLVPAVRAEEGCLAYGPTVEVDAGLDLQLPIRDHVVTVIEQWQSLEALQAHLAAPHMRQFRERVATLVDGLTIRVQAPVGS